MAQKTTTFDIAQGRQIKGIWADLNLGRYSKIDCYINESDDKPIFFTPIEEKVPEGCEIITLNRGNEIEFFFKVYNTKMLLPVYPNFCDKSIIIDVLCEFNQGKKIKVFETKNGEVIVISDKKLDIPLGLSKLYKDGKEIITSEGQTPYDVWGEVTVIVATESD